MMMPHDVYLSVWGIIKYNAFCFHFTRTKYSKVLLVFYALLWTHLFRTFLKSQNHKDLSEHSPTTSPEVLV